MSNRWVVVLAALAACSSTDPAQEKAHASKRVLALLQSGTELAPAELFEVDSLTHTHDLRMAHGSTETFHASAIDARLTAIEKLLRPRTPSYEDVEIARAHFDRVYPPLTGKQQTRLASLRRRFAAVERQTETATTQAVFDNPADDPVGVYRTREGGLACTTLGAFKEAQTFLMDRDMSDGTYEAWMRANGCIFLPGGLKVYRENAPGWDVIKIRPTGETYRLFTSGGALQ